MRKLSTLILVFIVAFTFGAVAANAGNGDAKGNLFHNFYQWMADDDGDGIPNGQDEDWMGPGDGTGYQHQNETANSFGESIRTQLQQKQQTKTEAGILTRLRERLGNGIFGDN